MLPGYQAVTGRSYNTAMQQMERAQIYCHQCSKPLGRCQCTLAAGCTRMAYSVSCTSAKTIETNYLKGPGYQNPPPSSLVQPVFEGTRSVIFPRREIDATRPYSASAANAVSLPWRASVSKAVSELPEEPANWTLPNERSGVLGVGHEQMPGYAQFVDSQALGKQSHYDPECITDAMRRGYQEAIYDGIALDGGTKMAQSVQANEWRALRASQNLKRDLKKSGREDAGPECQNAHNPVTPRNYSEITQWPRDAAPAHGDIPAWAPKHYETTPKEPVRGVGASQLLGSSRVTPSVALQGVHSPRTRGTLASCDSLAAQGPGSLQAQFLNRDTRLAVPYRETMASKGMQSHLLTNNPRGDLHSGFVAHMRPTPRETKTIERTLMLPRW